MPTHKQAIATIRYEYAAHGQETRESMRAYIENRISFGTRLKAVREGLRVYEKTRKEEITKKYIVCPSCHSVMYQLDSEGYKCSYCGMIKRGEK